MDRYSGNQTMEGADPVAEWTAPSGETGLEEDAIFFEPMWQLGLGSGPESYPERPDEADCIYYLRTGFCGYGARCRFNHPRDRTAALGAMRASGGEYPERIGQPDCQIEHKHVEVNGLQLHVAEIGGNGSNAVLFCHGFPEIWYSWRHQMIAVAKAGYRAIAPDYRGYGLSDPPPEPEKASYADFIRDLYSLLDVLGISKVFLIGKDFGARVVYLFALIHPQRVAGVVTLGIPFLPPKLPSMTQGLPEGFYMARWQERGRAEADFGRLHPKAVVRNIYVLFSRAEIPIAEENQEIMDLVNSSTPLPPWFTEEDLANYGALYEKSGFQTALKVPYRSMNEEFNISEVKVDAPALLIMGEKDYFIKFPQMEDYIRSDQAKMFVPNLETVFIPEGSHFVQEQFPDQVNELILNFLKNHG